MSASSSPICHLLIKLLTHLLISIIFFPQSILPPPSVSLLKILQGQECPLLLIYSDCTHTSRWRSISNFFKRFFWVSPESQYPHYSFYCLSTAFYWMVFFWMFFITLMFNILSCILIFIYIHEYVPPSLGPGWQLCSTNASSIPPSVPNQRHH